MPHFPPLPDCPHIFSDISKDENLNLSDLDLKKLKLSEEDALALSYLTPALSKRIQKQLLSQLAPSEARKLHRTLSSRSPGDTNPYDNIKDSQKFVRGSSAGRISSTLPRRFSVDRDLKNNNLTDIDEKTDGNANSGLRVRSFLPVKSGFRDRTPHYEFNVRSSSIGAEPKCDPKLLYRKPTFGRSTSARDPPKSYRADPNLQSPESSISESLSRNDDSSSFRNSISDLSSSRSYSRYSEPSKYSGKTQPQGVNVDDKTDAKKPSSARRISRFLRPDFFEGQKEDKDNVVLKEKKEKELETQKVLKEIRDKRKSRLNLRRERSASRDRADETKLPDLHAEVNKFLEAKNELKETKALLNNVSDNIKKLETTVQSTSPDITTHSYVNVPIHDYVNVNINGIKHDYVNVPEATEPTIMPNEVPVENNAQEKLPDYVNMKGVENGVKKEKPVSKIARPKSYPAEKNKDKLEAVSPKLDNTSPEKESKISRLRKGLVKQSSKDKEEKTETSKTNGEEKSHKNKLLQSIEKKLEKFRSSNIAATKDPEEVKVLQEKKSSVESAIKRLREQSMPRNIDHCTESGLIKRAVSVEEMPNNKPLQASRKSVTKILGLFKKYEEQDKKKVVKKSKSGDKEKKDKAKNVEDKKLDNKEAIESVIISNTKNNNATKVNSVENNDTESNHSSQLDDVNSNGEQRKERPRSLMFDKVKPHVYNGAKSDSVATAEIKPKSKLPVNNYRRSLNLDNLPEPPKFYKNPTRLTPDIENNNLERPDRRNLRLDLNKVGRNNSAAVLESFPSTSTSAGDIYRRYSENRNSLTTPDESSTFLSPGDDNASDTWSVCSDFHAHDLHSPISPNGHIYSGDENESVIDRIRRKSFYTR